MRTILNYRGEASDSEAGGVGLTREQDSQTHRQEVVGKHWRLAPGCMSQEGTETDSH